MFDTRSINTVILFYLVSTLNQGFAAESFETEVRAALDDYHAALESGDLARILDSFSESYSNAAGATKAMLSPFFSDPGVRAALQEQQQVNFDETTFQMDDGVVVVTPISYESPLTPPATWTYRFSKEADGVWRLINSEPIE